MEAAYYIVNKHDDFIMNILEVSERAAWLRFWQLQDEKNTYDTLASIPPGWIAGCKIEGYECRTVLGKE